MLHKFSFAYAFIVDGQFDIWIWLEDTIVAQRGMFNWELEGIELKTDEIWTVHF